MNIAYISARGGSKGIPFKNIKTFNGKPLVMWCAEEAANSKFTDRVIIASDSRVILRSIERWKQTNKIETWKVPEISDEAMQEETMLEFAKHNYFSNIMLMQATSPFTTADDIDHAFEKFIGGKYDSLVSVVRQHRFLWGVVDSGEAFSLNYNPMKRPRRQDWNGLLIENGAFFITSRDNLLESGNRISGKTGVYEMAPESYFEIDDETDWEIAEQLMKRREANE